MPKITVREILATEVDPGQFLACAGAEPQTRWSIGGGPSY